MKTRSLTILTAAVLATAAVNGLPALHAQAAGQPLAKEAVLSSLASKLDTKKTKVGDPVAVKTLNPLQLADGTTLPSGSKLVGKVTQVQPKSSGTATIAILFTELDKKGAPPMQVRGMIAGVAPMPDTASGGAAANDLPMRGTAAQNAAQTGASAGSASTSESISAGSAIKDVTLNPAPAADGSSVLQSTTKDFKLDSGTRFEIGLSAAQ